MAQTNDARFYAEYWAAYNRYLDIAGIPNTTKGTEDEFVLHVFESYTDVCKYVHVASCARCEDEHIGVTYPHICIEFVFRTKAGVSVDDACFDALKQRRADIELELGEPLNWDIPRDRFYGYKLPVLKEADIDNREDWPNQFKWMADRVVLFRRVFIKYLDTVLYPIMAGNR